LEVDDLFDVAGLHVQNRAEARREGFEEPDVRNGRSQVDVAHALTAHAAVRDLHAATITDDAFVFRALVLPARAFPVTFRPEDALAKEPVLLGAVRAVVDGLRLLHLAERPRTNIVRAGELDADGTVVVNAIVDGFSHDNYLFLNDTSLARDWT